MGNGSKIVKFVTMFFVYADISNVNRINHEMSKQFIYVFARIKNDI